LRQVSDSESYQKLGGKQATEPAKPSSSRSAARMSLSGHNLDFEPTQRPSSRASSHQAHDYPDRLMLAPQKPKMIPIYEDPSVELPFGREEDRMRSLSEMWKLEATAENEMRKGEGYCLASLTPPKGWDGTFASAGQYLMNTRMFPPGMTHAPIRPLGGYGFPTTDHSSTHHSPSFPIYTGPPPDVWHLNNSMIQTERESSQGPRHATQGSQGRYQSETTWQDVNMHADKGAGPSNAYRPSRFVPSGNGAYAQLQRRL
jgi:hypothetical protein